MTPSYFVIFAAMRTGSNLLERLLAGLPGLSTYGEAFNPAFVGGPNKDPLPGWTLERRNRDPLGYLAAMRADAGGRLFGFRHFDGHDPVIRSHALRDPACLRIVLRRDPAESYVSLKIAQQTGQWMLGVARRRLVARPRFVPEEYDAYVAGLEGYYRSLDAAMQEAGTEAVRIAYDDLSDLAPLRALAHALGCPVPDERPDPGILQQNPEPLEDRVENGADMLAHLARQPMRLRRWKRVVRAVLAADHDLALLPLSGAEAQCWGFLSDFRREGLEDIDNAPDVALEALNGRRLVTVVEPPVWRAVRLYLEQAFAGPRALPHLRRELDDRFGRVSRRKGLEGKADPDALALHRERFAGFLRAIAMALVGEGVHPVHEGWRPQADELDDLEDAVGSVLVAKLDDPEAGWPDLAAAGLAVQVDCEAPMALERLMTPDLMAEVKRLYARDFDRFGDRAGRNKD